VDSLNSGYANSHVLFGVDFEAKEKEITVIVGPNGSGKSTLLKSIFGLCAVYSGKITFGDITITGLAPHQVARKKIAYLPQVNNIFSNLTIKENLSMASYTLDSKQISQRLPEIFETFPVLKKYEKKKADIAEHYYGAIGSTKLNEAGDLAQADYEVWGIRGEEWVLLGKYTQTTDSVSLL